MSSTFVKKKCKIKEYSNIENHKFDTYNTFDISDILLTSTNNRKH